MNSVAFIVIAILTLAAALAAATLQKLMHAALSFAVTFVGIATNPTDDEERQRAEVTL